MGLAGIDDLTVVDSQLAVRVQACHMVSSHFEEFEVELGSGWRECSAGCWGPDLGEGVDGLGVVARAVVLRTVLAADHNQEGSRTVARTEEALLQAADTHIEPVVAGLHRSRIAAVEEERLASTFPSTQAHSRLPGLDCRTLQTAHRDYSDCA